MTRTIEAVGASFATFVPAVLERLLDGVAGGNAMWPRERLRTLRAIASGGEALPANVPGAFRAAFGAPPQGTGPGVELFNAYGPTETSIGVTGIPIREGDEPPYPIGRAVAGVRLRVVDRVGRTLPIGSFGELAISGVQVGRGYAGDAAKTAERFRDLGDRDGASYLTGDLATIDEQGVVRFYGRMDFQFKVRGVRIEAEEIERAMCEVSGVQSAVVWYRGDGGARKVIGYYRPVGAAEAGGATALEQRLRAHLKEVLPAQVVPAAFVAVDAWPLSANGKVDRRRLVPPADLGTAEASDPLAPPASTLAERQLRARVAEIFAEVLKTREVRMTSSFLDLGGDSLGAVVLLDKIAREFGLAPGIADFLGEPTPVAIARRLLAGGATVRVEPVVVIHPSKARETLHCLPGVGGLAAFTYLPIAGELAGEIRCLGYQLPGAGDGEKPMLSFRRMAKLLADRVEGQTPEGDIHLMGYSFGGHLAVEIAAMLAARGRTIATLVVLDAAPPRVIERVRMVARTLARSLRRGGASSKLTRTEELAGFRSVRGDDLGEVERRLRAVMRLSQVSVALHLPGAIPCTLDLVVSNGGDVGVAGFRQRVESAWKPYARHGLRIESSDTGHVMLVRYGGVPAIARVLRRSLAEQAARRAVTPQA
jgi:enterobactin synthetase component F